ncbi:hypothetical protein GCM10020256_55180 [Streptomyces thermocoprophilus]
MTVDTPFDLASVTKLFTSVAAVQQIERGTLGIDALVGAYLPEFTGAAEAGVTVRQLLTHTSGLRPELPLYDCADDTERLALLRAEAPSSPPGTYRYSDLNMLLLQHLLERLTDRPLDVLIHDGITRPLGMTATSFGPRPDAAATEDQRKPLGQGRPGHAAGRGPRRERVGARRCRRARGAVLHGVGPRGVLPHPARRRLLRARPHPRPSTSSNCC